MTPTANEVVEAIDVAIDTCREHAAEIRQRYDGYPGRMESARTNDNAAAILERHRSSLLEKGGPDAVPDLPVLPAAVHGDSAIPIGREVGPVAGGQSNPVDAQQSRDVAPPPLEKGARFSESEAHTLDSWLVEIDRRLIEPLGDGHYGWVRFPGLKGLRDFLALLRRGDDTPGGRT